MYSKNFIKLYFDFIYEMLLGFYGRKVDFVNYR